jgi:putative SOS response-associated peptidase YedK
VLVIGQREGRAPRASMMRWGLVPYWADDPRIGHKLINARIETFDEKPAFRGAAKKRRCLVPASGYYDWKKLAKGRQPYFVRPEGAPLLAFAGLWERWRGPEGKTLFTCTVLTEPAKAAVASLHDRMPVVLPKSAWAAWLDPARGADDARREALASREPPEVEIRAVSSRVNAVANEGPENLEAAPE